MGNEERLTKYVTPVGMCMTTLNSMKHYMPCVRCRHDAQIKTDSSGKQYTEKFGFCDTCEVKMLFNRLKEYEDLEEQGLLLRLPCKVGDKVYSPTRNFVSVYTICSIEVYNEGFFFNWRCDEGIYINVKGFTDYDFGKIVFPTKAEAEKVLKEMEIRD